MTGPTGTGRISTIGRRLGTADALPQWFASGLYVVLVWCAVAGMSALVLLWIGTYNAALCSAIATVATAGAFPFRPRTRDTGTAAHAPALAAVAIALALLTIAGVSHSEHLLVDRDPGAYLESGRSIARTHRIDPIVAPGPFDDARTFALDTSGFKVEHHRLSANFLGFLPALLALGWSAGGDTGLLLVPALLGALASLAFYALSTKIVGPRWALLGPALLVLAPLQSWFARDAFAELPLELLALGGLWLLLEAWRRGGAAQGAIAGVVLGATAFVRVDALAVVVALPAALAVEYLRAAGAEPNARRRRRAALCSFVIALGATAAGGMIVSHGLSARYLTDLRDNVRHLELGVAVGVVVAAGVLTGHRIRAGIGHRIARNDIVIAGGAVITIAIAVYAYVWRARTGTPPTLPPPGPARAVARKALYAFYDSASFHWFAWYLGIFTVVLAVAGLVLLGTRAARGDSPALIFLAAALPTTLLYIARPSIGPDQLWAMRRFLPIVLPLVTIAAAAAARWSTAGVGAWRPYLRAPFALALLAATLVPAALSGLPFAGAQTQGGALDAVHELCRAAGPGAAIGVEPYDLLGAELPQTLRGFCGVPAAEILPASTIPLATYARQWSDAGRRLFVVSAAREPVLAAAPGAVEVAHVVVADAREPERTSGRRPKRYAPRPLGAWLYRVDPV